MAKKSKWDKYNKAAKEAVKEAKDTSSVVTDRIQKKKMSLIQGGRKRKESGQSASLRKPLNGCTHEDSEKIRQVIGMKFAGYTMGEAVESVGLNPGSAPAWLACRQEAVDMAEHQHMERCLRAYQTNLWIVRTALSEVGPRAVRTLAAIMDDKKVSPGIRKDCAVQVLKLVDVDHSATGGANEGMAKELISLIRDASSEINTENIIEAEEAEVVHDGTIGN